jgi:hypothetical protein
MGGDTKDICPDAATSGFFNKLRFGWMNNVVRQARKGDPDAMISSLPLPSEQTADVAYGTFSANWEAAIKEGKPNLRKVLWKSFGKDLMHAGLFKLMWSVW